MGFTILCIELFDIEILWGISALSFLLTFFGVEFISTVPFLVICFQPVWFGPSILLIEIYWDWFITLAIPWGGVEINTTQEENNLSVNKWLEQTVGAEFTKPSYIQKVISFLYSTNLPHFVIFTLQIQKEHFFVKWFFLKKSLVLEKNHYFNIFHWISL